MKKLLEVRTKAKSKKPDFAIQDFHKRKEVRKRWRRPRGMHSKMRLCKKGHRKMPSPGYRSPEAVRGLSREGLNEVLVKNLQDLQEVKNEEGIIIARIGAKKRIAIIKEALTKGIKILNIRKPEDYEKQVMDKKKKEKKVEETKEEKPKKPKKKSIEEKVREEDKKKIEKKEKDKLLTRRKI